MDGLTGVFTTISIDDVLPVLQGITRQALVSAQASTPTVSQPVGVTLLFSKTIGQAQKAMGLRRQFDYFSF